MTDVSNNAEGGSTGTGVTTGNSGGTSGTAWQVVGLSPTCTLTFDSTRAAHGSLSYKVLLGATAGESYGEWSTSLTAAATAGPVYTRGYYYFTANPSANLFINRMLSGTTLRGGVVITSTGKLAAVNAAGTAVNTSTNAIPLNAWFRVEASFTGSTTTGQITIRLYTSMDSTTITETVSTAATINTGGTLDRVRFGHSGTGMANLTFWQDDIAASTTAFIGPASAATPIRRVGKYVF